MIKQNFHSLADMTTLLFVLLAEQRIYLQEIKILSELDCQI